MAKNLVIVESPAKARTIEGFLGKDFVVKSCNGHIRDLAKGNDAIDIKNGYKPVYEIADEKKALVAELKKMAKQSEIIWLASDEDREGEAISWHLSEVLGLSPQQTKRIVFHEITKPAIIKAIENPRTIDQHLVNAQQARRILDRLVGFELSPILWKKVKPALSAGRVQSVAVRLIVEREREINEFASTSAFRITAEFTANGKTIRAELPEKFSTRAQAEQVLATCLNAAFKVKNIEVKPAKRTPAAPFTTSTLQQEASRKLGYSVAQTMRIAQKLYEAGYITYMRTDSVNLSDVALAAARKEILSAYGEPYSQTRKYTTKTSGAQEAHEAIRPTYFENHTINGDRQEKSLYELIWKRAIASQMSDAQLEKTVVNIGIFPEKSAYTGSDLVAQGEVLKFDGFLKVYLEGHDDDHEAEQSGILPKVEIGQVLQLEQMQATQRFTRPHARYTEASLVKKLEELGIGRPSTYAPTISTIMNRGYVVKEDREGKNRDYEVLTLQNNTIKAEKRTEVTGAEKAKLFPSDIGTVVTDFLVKYFSGIMDYGFTASVEKEFDEIAHGMKEWTRMIDSFYKPFHKEVDTTLESADRATGERILGKDPATGKPVLVRIGRFGPMAQIGEKDDEKVQFASLRPGQMIETISLEEALDLFKLPRIVGAFEGKDVKVAIGRFGPYIQHNSKFVSLPKTDDPYTLQLDRAIELIEAKRKADAEKLIRDFKEDDTLFVLNGRWGPYITQGKVNYKIPKGTDPKSLTYADIMQIIANDDPAANKSARAAAARTAKATKAKAGTAKPKKPAAKKAAAKKKK